MKKVLSVLLAVLMLFTSFAFVGTAAGDSRTLADILAEVKGWDAASYNPSVPEDQQTHHVILLFQCNDYRMGTVFQGRVSEIGSGINAGCTALYGEDFVEGAIIQLPNLVAKEEGSKLDWRVATTGLSCSGETKASGNDFVIPKMNATDRYIVLVPVLSTQETQDTFSKILTIFYKVIKFLLGVDIANKLAQLFIELGVQIEITEA